MRAAEQAGSEKNQERNKERREEGGEKRRRQTMDDRLKLGNAEDGEGCTEEKQEEQTRRETSN